MNVSNQYLPRIPDAAIARLYVLAEHASERDGARRICDWLSDLCCHEFTRRTRAARTDEERAEPLPVDGWDAAPDPEANILLDAAPANIADIAEWSNEDIGGALIVTNSLVAAVTEGNALNLMIDIRDFFVVMAGHRLKIAI